jgi:hypothetical protein
LPGLLKIASRAHKPVAPQRRFAAGRVGLPLLALLVTLMVAGSAQAAQPTVGLGTAASFAVLSGAGITNTGPTTITGDVGTFPTPAETGFGSVTLNGTNHAGDAVTQQAKTDPRTTTPLDGHRSPGWARSSAEKP